MRIVSYTWREILVVWPGLFRFTQKLFRTRLLPRGMALWPFLVVRDEEALHMPWLLNHERIHLAQQREMLVVGLEVQQILEALVSRYWFKKSREETYYGFSFEQESYLNQHNLDYLKTRKPFAHFRYLKNKKRFRVTDTPGELEFY